MSNQGNTTNIDYERMIKELPIQIVYGDLINIVCNELTEYNPPCDLWLRTLKDLGVPEGKELTRNGNTFYPHQSYSDFLNHLLQKYKLVERQVLTKHSTDIEEDIHNYLRPIMQELARMHKS